MSIMASQIFTTTWLFVQQLVSADSRWLRKARFYWPFVRRISWNYFFLFWMVYSGIWQGWIVGFVRLVQSSVTSECISLSIHIGLQTGVLAFNTHILYINGIEICFCWVNLVCILWHIFRLCYLLHANFGETCHLKGHAVSSVAITMSLWLSLWRHPVWK